MLIYALSVMLASAQVKVITSSSSPLGTCSTGSTTGFSGFYSDLMYKIAEDMNWSSSDWTFTCVSSSVLTSEIESGTADVAIGPISLSSDNLSTMKLSTPTIDVGLVLVVKNHERSVIWLFLEPFEFSLWILLGIIALGTAHIIWVLERRHDGPFPFSYKEGILESIWHSFTSMFLVGDKDITTVPGRLMQLCYWFMCFVLLAAYTSDLTARLSLPQTYTSIKDYTEIDDKTVGVYSDYQSVITSMGASTQVYSSDFDTAKTMIDDVKDGNIDAALLPLHYATYLTTNECKATIVGDVIIIDYYAIAFSNSLADTTVQGITASNAKMYQLLVNRSLSNKALKVSDEESCSRLVEMPVSIEATAGLWIIVSFGVVLAFPAYLLHKKFKKNKIEEEDTDTGKYNFDYKNLGELDLISKFEKILGSSEHKFIQKMRDIEAALEKYSDASNNLEKSLGGLSTKLKTL